MRRFLDTWSEYWTSTSFFHCFRFEITSNLVDEYGYCVVHEIVKPINTHTAIQEFTNVVE